MSQEWVKKDVDFYINKVRLAEEALKDAKRSLHNVTKLHMNNEVSMSRRNGYYVFEIGNVCLGTERFIVARKDGKTKRWTLRENGKQIMSKCPYNLNEIRLKIAIGEI